LYTQTHKLRYYAKNLIGMPGLATLYQLTHYVGTFWRISRTEPQFGSFTYIWYSGCYLEPGTVYIGLYMIKFIHYYDKISGILVPNSNSRFLAPGWYSDKINGYWYPYMTRLKGTRYSLHWYPTSDKTSWYPLLRGVGTG
jgi:hypothetical protein